MLEKIIITKDFRKIFKIGDTFEFRRGVNLLVGDQGTGKSSLITILREPGVRREHAKYVVKDNKAFGINSFDFEKDNLRTKSYIENGLVGFQVASHFMSHGQTNWPILEALLKEDKFKNSLIVLDEPDMALSIRSSHKLVDLFNQLIDRDCQVIAAVHNYLIIKSFEQVYSLEHRRWMDSLEFIHNHSSIDNPA